MQFGFGKRSKKFPLPQVEDEIALMMQGTYESVAEIMSFDEEFGPDTEFGTDENLGSEIDMSFRRRELDADYDYYELDDMMLDSDDFCF